MEISALVSRFYISSIYVAVGPAEAEEISCLGRWARIFCFIYFRGGDKEKVAIHASKGESGEETADLSLRFGKGFIFFLLV